MKLRLYITAPSYSMKNPVEKAKTLKTAQTWADALGWYGALAVLGRYFEAGVWLPAAARAEDTERALQHEIVWAFRGGYGAVHLVPALLQAQAAGQPLLIGYSDITVLHRAWRVRGWGPAIDGTLSESTTDARQAESLMAFLKGEAYDCSSETETAARAAAGDDCRAPLLRRAWSCWRTCAARPPSPI